MSETPRHINDILDELLGKITPENNKMGDILDVLHERGFGILIFILALPMALPVPVPPGMNLLFALPLAFLTFQQIYGAHTPWLPEFMTRKEVNPDKLKDLLRKSKPWLNRISAITKPRMGWVTNPPFSNLIGVLGFLFSLCVCIPVPLTNTVPSFAILFMALGIIMRDGVTIILGMIIGSAWIGLLATLGITGFKALLSAIM